MRLHSYWVEMWWNCVTLWSQVRGELRLSASPYPWACVWQDQSESVLSPEKTGMRAPSMTEMFGKSQHLLFRKVSSGQQYATVMFSWQVSVKNTRVMLSDFKIGSESDRQEWEVFNRKRKPKDLTWNWSEEQRSNHISTQLDVACTSSALFIYVLWMFRDFFAPYCAVFLS